VSLRLLLIISFFLISRSSPKHSELRVEATRDDFGADIDASLASADLSSDAGATLPEQLMPASGSEEKTPPEPAAVHGKEALSAQQDIPTGGEESVSPRQVLLPSASSALVIMPVPKLFRARKLPINKST